jgi:hypothetical protein
MAKSHRDMAEEVDRKVAKGTEFDDVVPVEGQVSKQPRAVFSVRLSPTELGRFSKAAHESGMTLSDWMRAAALAALDDERVPSKAAALEKVRHQVEELADTVRKL